LPQLLQKRAAPSFAVPQDAQTRLSPSTRRVYGSGRAASPTYALDRLDWRADDAAAVGEIIGRERELAAIERLLHPPGGRRALILEGQAGIGKSTLWLAGMAAARARGFEVLTARPAEAERTLPNVVLGDLFGALDRETLGELPAPRRRALEAALLREDAAGPVDAHALGLAVTTLLSVLAARRPVVLAIDDEQWVDPSSAATLRFALRRLPEATVVALLARRVEGDPASVIEEALDASEVERVRLEPLSVGAIQAILSKETPLSLPRLQLRRLHEASGGNPFVALELARAASADSGIEGKPWVVAPSLDRLVAERLAGVPAATLHALLLLAAHGRLPAGLVRDLGLAPATLEPALRARLMERSAEALSFTHPLLASGVYQGASDAERRAAHRSLAAAIADPVQRARHVALAADQPEAETAAALESAARAARDRGLPLAAVELAGHAIRLTPSGASDDRQRRALLAARAHVAAGEGARARAIAAEVVDEAASGRHRAEALLLVAELESADAAVTLLLRALTDAKGMPELEALIHARVAEAGRLIHGRDWAEGHARASLDLAERLDDDALRAGALAVLGLLRFDVPDPDAQAIAERADRLAAAAEDPEQQKRAALSVGHILVWSGQHERARDWLERELDVWRDRDELARAELHWYLAITELWSGRWTVAAKHAEESRGITRHYGLELPQHLLPAALLALHRGQLDVAAGLSDRALSIARGEQLPAHTAILGLSELWAGRPGPGVSRLLNAEAAANARGLGEPGLRWWRGDLVEGLLRLGRGAEAATLLDGWQADASRLGRDGVLAHVARCRGLMAASAGDLAGAARLLDDAVARHEAADDPFGAARALLALGATRRRARQKRTAREPLELALGRFEALGAAGWAQAARTEIRRVGGRRRLEGLSESERGVAELVASGMTNREIAGALFLSERTVVSHLTHVYTKLGIRSRTELTRQLLLPTEPDLNESSKVPTS
jgi:DNA-binding CsgD family transcriptional regulator